MKTSKKDTSTTSIIWTNTWKGYYECRVDNIEILVSKCTGGWEVNVNDLNGKDEEGTFTLLHDFAPTKKEAIKLLINWININ